MRRLCRATLWAANRAKFAVTAVTAARLGRSNPARRLGLSMRRMQGLDSLRRHAHCAFESKPERPPAWRLVRGTVAASRFGAKPWSLPAELSTRLRCYFVPDYVTKILGGIFICIRSRTFAECLKKRFVLGKGLCRRSIRMSIAFLQEITA